MRVIVCGGRNYKNVEHVRSVLDDIGPSLVIQGGAYGADRIAEIWAIGNDVETHRYEPDWEKHGRSAGPTRNQRMIDDGKPDLVVAFPGGRGTADMTRKAKAAGIEVLEIPPAPAQEGAGK